MASNQKADTTEYRLCPLVPEGLDEKATYQCLEEQLDAVLAFLSKYLVDYIWQNEPFQLRVVPETGEFTCLSS